MSISRITGGTNLGVDFVAGGSVSCALGGAVQEGDLVVVICSHSAPSNDLASDKCTDSLGNGYFLGGSGFESIDVAGMSWHYGIVTKAGTPTVTVTFLTSQPNRVISAYAYRSSMGPMYLDKRATLATHSDILGVGPPDNVFVGPIIPEQNNELIVAGFAQYSNNNALSAGTGFTMDADSGAATISYASIESMIQGAAASQMGLGSDAGAAARYLGFVASFKEVLRFSAPYPKAPFRGVV